MAASASWPSWANELADKYRGGTIIEFVLHGAVHDLVRSETEKGERTFVSLKAFLEGEVFRRRDVVITYDVSRGITFTRGDMLADFQTAVQGMDTVSGTDYAKQGLPRDARRALYLIERYLRSRVDPAAGGPPAKKVAVVIDFAHMVCPAGDPSHMSSEEQATLDRK